MRVRLNAAKSNSIFFHRPVRERYGPKKQKARSEDRAFRNKPGNFLLSHTVACAVPSGLRGLTSVFGMGTGGSLSLRSPRNWLRTLGDPRISAPLRSPFRAKY